MLVSLEDYVESAILRFREYLLKSKERLITAGSNSNTNRIYNKEKERLIAAISTEYTIKRKEGLITASNSNTDVDPKLVSRKENTEHGLELRKIY